MSTAFVLKDVQQNLTPEFERLFENTTLSFPCLHFVLPSKTSLV